MNGIYTRREEILNDRKALMGGSQYVDVPDEWDVWGKRSMARLRAGFTDDATSSLSITNTCLKFGGERT